LFKLFFSDSSPKCNIVSRIAWDGAVSPEGDNRPPMMALSSLASGGLWVGRSSSARSGDPVRFLVRFLSHNHDRRRTRALFIDQSRSSCSLTFSELCSAPLASTTPLFTTTTLQFSPSTPLLTSTTPFLSRRDLTLATRRASSSRPSEGSSNDPVFTPSTASAPEPSSSPETASETASETTASASRAARLKRAAAEYGVVVPIFHISLALTSLGFFYVLVSAGVDFDALFALFGVDGGDSAGDDGNENGSSDSGRSSGGNLVAGVSTFALAYAVHKLFAPVRIGVTLSVAPLLVKWTRKNVTPKLVKWSAGVKAALCRTKSS